MSEWTAPTFDGTEPAHVGKQQRTRSAISKSNRVKGASGEREVLAALRDVMANVEEALTLSGVTVKAHSAELKRNSLQSRGGGHDLHAVPLLSVEVKRVENLNVTGAWEQCLRQASNRELPVLIYRKNNAKWLVRTYAALYDFRGVNLEMVVATVALPDFLAYYAKLYRSWLEGNRDG